MLGVVGGSAVSPPERGNRDLAPEMCPANLQFPRLSGETDNALATL